MMEESETPSAANQYLPALFIACVALAALPIILFAFAQFIDGRFHITDVWPDFWNLLDQIKPWWLSGFALAAVFIVGRVLVNYTRRDSIWRLVAAAIWWLLLAVAPLFVIAIILAVNRRTGHINLRSDVIDVIALILVLWLFGVPLLAAFLGGRQLRTHSKFAWRFIGGAICWLVLASTPLAALGMVVYSYRDLNYEVPEDVLLRLRAIWAIWLFLLVAWAIWAGVRKLLARYSKPESPQHLLTRAVGWVLLASVPALAIGVALGAVGSANVTNEIRGRLDEIEFLSFAGIILIGAFIEGRVSGHGVARAGLGDGRVSNYAQVISLAAAAVVYAVLVNVVFHPRGSSSTFVIIPESPSHNLYVFFLGVCAAPLSEELFLRGWMWTGLRKSWDVERTTLITGGIWLVAHFPNGILSPFILLPVAIILSAARHIGESVRAPIAIHAIYNLTILLMSLRFVS